MQRVSKAILPCFAIFFSLLLLSGGHRLVSGEPAQNGQPALELHWEAIPALPAPYAQESEAPNLQGKAPHSLVMATLPLSIPVCRAFERDANGNVLSNPCRYSDAVYWAFVPETGFA